MFTYGAQWGYYTDGETSLILCGHRYYDPARGRWLNRDPIGYAGGVDLYGYCGNGPVGGMDPSGLLVDGGGDALYGGLGGLGTGIVLGIGLVALGITGAPVILAGAAGRLASAPLLAL